MKTGIVLRIMLGSGWHLLFCHHVGLDIHDISCSSNKKRHGLPGMCSMMCLVWMDVYVRTSGSSGNFAGKLNASAVPFCLLVLLLPHAYAQCQSTTSRPTFTSILKRYQLLRSFDCSKSLRHV